MSIPRKALERLAYLDEVREIFAHYGYDLAKPEDYEEVREAKLRRLEECLQDKVITLFQMLAADHDSSGHC